MENTKQKIIAIVILILVVGGLVLLTIFLNNKSIDTGTGEVKGISLFTKKSPGSKDLKNQGNIGNQNNGTDFTGNDTSKPVSIIENVINTITGNTGSNTQNTDTTNSVSAENKTIGQVIRDFFLGDDGLPTNGATTQEDGENSESINPNSEDISKTIPGIDIPVELVDNGGNIPTRPECSPAVYISKLTRKNDLKLQLELGIKTQTTLTDEEKELNTWVPTKTEIDEDNMKRVLHRYWDIWSYPDNYLKSEENGDCGTWTDATATESDFFKLPASQIAVNETTINNAKREVRKSFSALGTIMSSTFSVSQSEGQRLIAQNDNIRYDDLLNDCRVIRSQFEGGFTYARDGKTRIDIPQYYFPNAQSGIATGRDNTTSSGGAFIADSHEKIAQDLARRVNLKSNTSLSMTDAEIVRYQDLSLKSRFGGATEQLTEAEKKELAALSLKSKQTQMSGSKEALSNLIRSEIIKSTLVNWRDDTNILSKTTMGNISYLWDDDNPDYNLDFDLPKHKAENITAFSGMNKDVARYYLTVYPKLQYGGPDGTRELRGNTFWSSGNSAQNFNPGIYMISEPQSIWDMLAQDRNKVLFCRVNKFMGQWAGIETNVRAAGYVNSHGINCDNEVRGDTLNIPGINKNTPNNDIRNLITGTILTRIAPQALLLGFTETLNPFARGGNISDSVRLSLDDIKKIGPLPSFYNMFDSAVIMREFIGVDRNNWYSNSVQNSVFEFIKDED